MKQEMSDWFKLYENGLDEPRLCYAVHQNPNVLNAWIWILSECCRSKSDTIRLRSDFDLKGASFKLNIPLDDILKGIELLVEIEYIENDNSHIKVLKWNDLQSDYCRKKRHSTKDSPEKSRKVQKSPCRREEKRREENRETKNIYTPEFIQFYSKYPRRIGKAGAMKAWCKAINVESQETIMAGLMRYNVVIKDLGTEIKFIKHPSTWLNQGCWDDEYEKPKASGTGPHKAIDYFAKLDYAKSLNAMNKSGDQDGVTKLFRKIRDNYGPGAVDLVKKEARSQAKG